MRSLSIPVRSLPLSFSVKWQQIMCVTLPFLFAAKLCPPQTADFVLSPGSMRALFGQRFCCRLTAEGTDDACKMCVLTEQSFVCLSSVPHKPRERNLCGRGKVRSFARKHCNGSWRSSLKTQKITTSSRLSLPSVQIFSFQSCTGFTFLRDPEKLPFSSWTATLSSANWHSFASTKTMSWLRSTCDCSRDISSKNHCGHKVMSIFAILTLRSYSLQTIYAH